MKKLLVIMVVLLYGCTNAPEETLQAAMGQTPTSTIERIITNTPNPTSTITGTPTRTNTPKPSNTPVPTSTPTTISDSLKEQIVQNYTAMVLIQTNANMLMEVAERIDKGELEGFESFGYVLGLAAMVGAIEEVLPEIEIATGLEDYWSESIKVHDSTKDILARWIEEEIDSRIVMEELEIPLERIDEIMTNLEEFLGLAYQFEASELTTMREEIVAEMEEIFENPPP
jgi:hypothetical protein